MQAVTGKEPLRQEIIRQMEEKFQGLRIPDSICNKQQVYRRQNQESFRRFQDNTNHQRAEEKENILCKNKNLQDRIGNAILQRMVFH